MASLQQLLAEIYERYETGEVAEAHRLLDEALVAHPDERELWQARAELARNGWEERRAWQKVLDLEPDHPAALAALAPESVPLASTSPVTLGLGQRQPLVATAGGPALSQSTSAPRTRRSFAMPSRDAWAGLGKQLAFWLGVLLTLIFLSFFGLEMARTGEGGAALRYAGTETIAYLGKLASGDLGTVSDTISQMERPITDVLRDALPKSLGLLAASLLFATVIGVFLGTLAALRRGAGWSLSLILFSIIGVSVPSFFAAILLQWGVLRYMRIFDAPAPLPLGGFGWDKHIILPMLVLAARPIAQITRVTFLSLREVLDQDFVRVAYSKGLSRRAVFGRHIVRNILIPVLTTIGLSLRFSLSSLPVVELFFGWPGVGQTLLEAISRRDDSLTVALVLSLGLLFIVVNALLELSFRVIDPRVRDLSRRATAMPNLMAGLRTLLSDVSSLVSDNPLTRWWRARQRPPEPSPFAAAVQAMESQSVASYDSSGHHRWTRLRAWTRGTLQNLPLILGTIMVGGLIIIALFGSSLAPNSPYTTNVILKIDDEFLAPPFPQSSRFPWGSDFLGRDIMSLVLAGAQQTLVLAGLVVLGRMLIGVVLGALSGWTRGSVIDRSIQSAAEILSAFPTLLLAMILILALGIRQGLRPFVFALVFVGWGEVMQYVRSQVITLKPKPFIESAHAVGLRTPRIVTDHVMPHVLPALLSIAALEMGATLMILGELGFIGIFIGGGIITEGGGIHYSDVPEWAAMLANVRRYVRSYPWMAIYPATAFFLAILAFNLFGEGMRQLVDNVGINLTRMFNRYTFAALLILFLSWGWIQDNTGDAVIYRQQASAFDGEAALAHVEALTAPEMEGRAIGTDGLSEAQAYIAEQFRELTVQTAGEEQSYFQPLTRDIGQLATVPTLEIDDGGEPLQFREDFSEVPEFFRSTGDVSGRVVVLSAGELSGSGFSIRSQAHFAFRDLDLSESIVLLSDPRLFFHVGRIPTKGVLYVTPDEQRVGRGATLGANDPIQAVAFARAARGDRPALWITEEVANRLLASADTSVDDLVARSTTLPQDTVDQLELEPTVRMSTETEVLQDVPTANILAYIPGSSNDYDNRMIVLMTKYDGPPPSPDGEDYPNANYTASGVATMLEFARTIQESPYQSYKTILFVVYSTEGQDGGNFVGPPAMEDLLKAKYGFSGTDWDVEAVVDLSGVGAGTGSTPEFVAGGSLRLAALFETAARRMGSGAARAKEPVDISVIYSDDARPSVAGAQEVPTIDLHWQGWEESAGHVDDTFETIRADYLERVGEMLTYALMEFGRDVSE